MTKAAIVVVDLQLDFVEGGALGVAGGENVSTLIEGLVLPVMERTQHEIVFTRDWHIDPGDHFSESPDYVDSWPRHCMAESGGAQFSRDFSDWIKVDNVFSKGQFSASYSGADGVNIDGEGLIDYLNERDIDHVTVVGLAFDYCVAATAADLAEAGFHTRIVKDFTASVHPENDSETITNLVDRGVTVYDGGEYIQRNNANTQKA